jgi:hypothetical protein
MPMVITLQRKVYEELDDAALGWACIEPAMQQLKRERSEQLNNGEGVGVQSQVYMELTAGQQALLMFWVVYNHLKKEATDAWQPEVTT